MQKQELVMLAEKAAEIRKLAVEAIYHAKSGHPGGSLSIADIMSYLYFKEMKVDAADPKNPDRDRFVLSKGHCCPALYAALAMKGFFPKEDLNTLRHLGSYLSGHPDMKNVPGVDMSTGSLGQGISAAAGMALAGKRNGQDYRVFTILGDGECQEGQVWEAAMFAAHYKLDNLIAFVDFNHLQIDGDVREVMNPTPIDKKFEAFGWYVQSIDGHDFDAIEQAVENAKVADKPAVIVCTTVKGKGVSFMENNYGWHGKAPNASEYETAMAELDKALEEAKEACNNG
jgi:transketolase